MVILLVAPVMLVAFGVTATAVASGVLVVVLWPSGYSAVERGGTPLFDEMLADNDDGPADDVRPNEDA